MQTYFLDCKRHTYNTCPPKIIITNKMIRQKSRCANCMANKSLFLKRSLKLNGIIFVLDF